MPSNTAIIESVRRLFLDHLHVEVPDPGTDLVEGGILDSLMLVDLLVQLEQTFDVTVDVEDLTLDNFRTVERIGAYVSTARRHTSPGAAAAGRHDDDHPSL